MVRDTTIFITIKIMEKEKNIHILGGGPAGISVAYYASKNNFKFKLFEASNRLGGNCKTFNINGFLFDSGAHRFHDKDHESTKIIKEIMREELQMIHVPSQIFIDNKFVDFPLSPLNLIKFFGFWNILIETIKLLIRKLKKGSINNFKEYSIQRYGKKIAQKFLFDYSEKLWGLPVEELSIKISGKRLKGINFKTFLLELFSLNKAKVTHLDGSFYYPKYGIGTIFEKLSEFSGIENFNLNCKVKEILHNKEKILSVKINEDRIENVNYIVSSIPIDKFVKNLNPPAPDAIIALANSIQYRDIIVLIFLLDIDSVNSNGSMYFPGKEFIFTRIYEPRNRSNKMAPKGKTSLCVEIPTNKNNLNIEKKDKIINKVSHQLIEIGFFKENEIINVQMELIQNAYPILCNNYEKTIVPIQKYLKKFKNLSINGRNGKFEYTHIHDHIKDGRLIISDLISNYS